MSIIGGGNENELVCGQAVSTPPDLPLPSSLSEFGHLPPPHPYGLNHDAHFVPAPPVSSLGSYHPQFSPALGPYPPNSVPAHFNASYTPGVTFHQQPQPHQQPQQHPMHLHHQLHHHRPHVHPTTPHLSNSNPPFIKPNPDQHFPMIKQEPGAPYIDHDPGGIPWHASFNHTGSGQVHVKIEPQDAIVAPVTVIKQEPGLAEEHGKPRHGSTGPVYVKQEPGVDFQAHHMQYAYSSHHPEQQNREAHAFPSRPLNLNFMADIEDIIPSSTTPELTISSIQQELSSFDGPSDVKVGQRRVGVMREEEEEEDWEPPLWKQQYENIRTMRAKRDAPVDKYGCFMNAEKEVPPEVRRYQVLVSLMLSSQTKDEVVSKAMTKLKENGLTISNVINTPQEEIARMIFPVGFWNKKAEYIKKTTAILETKFGNDIPNSVEGLVSLPGIGPKMAHLIMDFAWGEVSGIAVDTHVHRITHRLGWMRREARNPEEARKYLEKWFPKSEWSDLNLLCVGFGQQVCHPVSPKCSECLNKDLCPSSSCLVSTGLPLGIGFEVSTKSKAKKAKSTLVSSDKRQSKKIKIEKE